MKNSRDLKIKNENVKKGVDFLKFHGIIIHVE